MRKDKQKETDTKAEDEKKMSLEGPILDKPTNGSGAPDLSVPIVEDSPVEDKSFAELNVETDEQGFPCLTLAQLYRWNTSSLEAENAKLTRELSMVTRQLWLEQQAAYRKLTGDINAAVGAKEEKDKKLKAVIDELSKDLGFKLEGCSVDDTTGRITFFDQRDRPMLGRTVPPDHARLKT